ncbi:hypothetical protein ACLB2K_064672 [Fragaria x ananassa]
MVHRYVSIIRKEGLEISQPALDSSKSEVHHLITARVKGSTVHRRTYKPNANGSGCDENSTVPPCTGWIEVMAPVFSRAAWRCGDRTKIGVVDAEYLIHYGCPTLGGPDKNERSPQSSAKDHRVDVRRESYKEMKMFRRKWEIAAKNDECWIDPYPVNSSRQYGWEKAVVGFVVGTVAFREHVCLYINPYDAKVKAETT